MPSVALTVDKGAERARGGLSCVDSSASRDDRTAELGAGEDRAMKSERTSRFWVRRPSARAVQGEAEGRSWKRIASEPGQPPDHEATEQCNANPLGEFRKSRRAAHPRTAIAGAEPPALLARTVCGSKRFSDWPNDLSAPPTTSSRTRYRTSSTRTRSPTTKRSAIRSSRSAPGRWPRTRSCFRSRPKDLSPGRAFGLVLFCSWDVYFWCVLAPLGLATLEWLLGIDKPEEHDIPMRPYFKDDWAWHPYR